jgi:hypothetical protein
MKPRRILILAVAENRAAVVHTSLVSKIEAFCCGLVRWGKTLRTFDSLHNINLMKMGVGGVAAGEDETVERTR